MTNAVPFLRKFYRVVEVTDDGKRHPVKDFFDEDEALFECVKQIEAYAFSGRSFCVDTHGGPLDD